MQGVFHLPSRNKGEPFSQLNFNTVLAAVTNGPVFLVEEKAPALVTFAPGAQCPSGTYAPVILYPAEQCTQDVKKRAADGDPDPLQQA